MAKRNITVAVDEDAYHAARAYAAENGTSVSAIVAYCIERLPGLTIAEKAVHSIRRQRSNSFQNLARAIERLSISLTTPTPHPPAASQNPTCATPEHH